MKLDRKFPAKRSLALLALALAATACETTGETSKLERDVDSALMAQSLHYPADRLAIAVRPATISHPVVFRSGTASLAQADVTILNAFVAHSGATEGDQVLVAISPIGGRSLADRRIAAVAGALQRHRLQVARSYAGDPAAPDSAIVTITRMVAVAPDCPEWERLMRATTIDNLRPRFGCLYSASLAASVHQPRDLDGGRPLGNSDGRVMEKGIVDLKAGKFDPAVIAVRATSK